MIGLYKNRYYFNSCFKMLLILFRYTLQTFYTENRLKHQIQLLQSNPENSLKKKVTLKNYKYIIGTNIILNRKS